MLNLFEQTIKQWRIILLFLIFSIAANILYGLQGLDQYANQLASYQLNAFPIHPFTTNAFLTIGISPSFIYVFFILALFPILHYKESRKNQDQPITTVSYFGILTFVYYYFFGIIHILTLMVMFRTLNQTTNLVYYSLLNISSSLDSIEMTEDMIRNSMILRHPSIAYLINQSLFSLYGMLFTVISILLHQLVHKEISLYTPYLSVLLYRWYLFLSLKDTSKSISFLQTSLDTNYVRHLSYWWLFLFILCLAILSHYKAVKK